MDGKGCMAGALRRWSTAWMMRATWMVSYMWGVRATSTGQPFNKGSRASEHNL